MIKKSGTFNIFHSLNGDQIKRVPMQWTLESNECTKIFIDTSLDRKIKWKHLFTPFIGLS